MSMLVDGGSGRELGGQNPGAVCEPTAVNPMCVWIHTDSTFQWPDSRVPRRIPDLAVSQGLSLTAPGQQGAECQNLRPPGECLLFSVLVALPSPPVPGEGTGGGSREGPRCPPQLVCVASLGWAKYADGAVLATGNLQRRSSLMTQPGLVRNEGKRGDV